MHRAICPSRGLAAALVAGGVVSLKTQHAMQCEEQSSTQKKVFVAAGLGLGALAFVNRQRIHEALVSSSHLYKDMALQDAKAWEKSQALLSECWIGTPSCQDPRQHL